MNYLAHTLLSRHADEAILGAILGDFVKGPLGDNYPPTVTDAIVLHRTIDRYTDAHPTVLSSRRRVSAIRRRFAPIMIDIFYDHFLARHWNDYCEIPLRDFARRVYEILRVHRAIVPERLRTVAPYMAADDWFNAYADIAGMRAAIDGVAHRLRRFRRAAVLRDGAEELLQHYAALERDFRLFFPELQNYVAVHPRLGHAA
ncbi:MAG TPA: ACP phosphodiesterase [Burkholderiales bacterium]|nr:ACP phosphodiesterase [Burkholderiales bacterium]